MAKPSALPTWNTSGTNRTEPSPTDKAAGWGLNSDGVSSWMNWWMHTAYLWAAYVDSGALEGDHSIDGNLDVTGDVRANGDLKFGAIRSKRVPGHTAVALGAHTRGVDGFIVQTNDALLYPLTVEVGDRIDSWLVWIAKGSSASQTLQARLVRIAPDGTSTPVGTTATNNASAPGLTALQVSGLAHDIEGDNSYYIECSAFNGGGVVGGADAFRGAELNYTRPA